MEGKDTSTPDCWQEARHIQDSLLSGHKLSRQQLKVGLLRFDFLAILQTCSNNEVL